MKRFSLHLCLAVLCASSVTFAQMTRRAKYSFNSGWKLFVGDPVGAEAPDFNITAAANGLKPASIEIVSRPIKIEGGLSPELPAEGLLSNLDRGPTPAGPSFAATRAPVSIARVNAGSNPEKAAATFDDNETTEWSSDGQIEHGWIKYDFAQPARVSEVVVKLVGWRTQSYPIRILVDEKIVFAGLTPHSLGYVTFTFRPVVGHSAKIELTGAASNRDAFGNIVEIPGTPDPQSSAGKGGGKNTLGIVEVEIYEPLVGTHASGVLRRWPAKTQGTSEACVPMTEIS